MTPNYTRPVDWLDLLHGLSCAGYMEFRAIPSRERRFMPCDAENFKLPLAWKTQNVYYGVAPRSESGKGTSDDLLEHNLIWADLDLKDTVYIEGDPKECSPSELQAAAQTMLTDATDTLENLGLTPRAIVYSGHGVQIIIALDAVLEPSDTESANRWLTEQLGGDPSTCDRARVLRMPGSNNVKNATRPLTVEVWTANPNAVNANSSIGRIERAKLEPRSGAYTTSGTITENDAATITELWESLRAKPDPSTPGRHYLALWIAGWLKRNSVAEHDALAFVQHCATTAGDEELEDRLQTVRDTYASSKNTRGWEGLTTAFGLTLEGIALSNSSGTVTRSGKVLASDADKKKAEKEEFTLNDYAQLFLDRLAENAQYIVFYEPHSSWWEYQHGVYTRVEVGTMLRRLDMLLLKEGFANLARSKLENIIMKVAHAVYRTRNDLGKRELNVKNGILNIETLELTTHTPELFTTVQIPTNWNAEADAPVFAHFLQTALPHAADRTVIQEFFGYALTGDMQHQKALALIGKGGTGKGTVTSVLQALLGGGNACALWASVDLDELKDNTPGIERLIDKRAVFVPEIQSHINWTTFKRLTGEDALTVNPKFRPTFDVRLDCKVIISSNVLPRLGEDVNNDSLTRRLIAVEFNVQPSIPDLHLRSRLTTESELSGVLTWLVTGVRRLWQTQMFATPTGDLKRRIVEESNRIITWLEENCENNGRTPSRELYSNYITWCDATRHRAVSETRFGRDLIGACSELGWENVDKVRMMQGMVYERIGLL